MATIDIKAVYSDMTKCAQILEDIGADVKVAYTDMDDFLNKKMVFNGKQIYANWQSDARTIFEEKAKLIVSLFTTVQSECAEAANTLRAVIKEYENRDSELASTTLGKNIKTKALDFKNFGNMASADWSGLVKPNYVIGGSTKQGGSTTKPTGASAADTARSTERSYFGVKVNGSVISNGGKGTDSTIYDVGLDKITVSASNGNANLKDLNSLLSKYNLGAYDDGGNGGVLYRDGKPVSLDIYAKDGKYYGLNNGKFTDITSSVNSFMNELQSKDYGSGITVTSIADVNKPEVNYANAANIWTAQEGKLYSDNAWANRTVESDLFNDGKIYRYHPGVDGATNPSDTTIGICGASNSYYASQGNIKAVMDMRGDMATKVDSLLKSTGADSVEWTCNGKYYDKNGTDVTSAVLKFQSEASKQGLQYDYFDTSRTVNINPDGTNATFTGLRCIGGALPSGSSDSYYSSETLAVSKDSLSALLSANPNAFGGATQMGNITVNGFNNTSASVVNA